MTIGSRNRKQPRNASANQVQDAHWEGSCYSITVNGATYSSLDGDRWINAASGVDDAPVSALRLINGPRSGEVVA